MKRFIYVALVVCLVILACTFSSCKLLDFSFLNNTNDTTSTIDANDTTSGTDADDSTSDTDSDDTTNIIDSDDTTSGGNNEDTTLIPEPPHVHTADGWQNDEDGHYKECKNCGEEFERGEHTPVLDVGTLPTCNEAGLSDGEHCEICEIILVEQTTINATGNHNLVPSEFVAPTFLEKGYLSGNQCTLCKTVFDSEGEIPSAENACGDYVYNALSSEGEKQFYKALYDKCVEFHIDTETDIESATYSGTEKYVAFEVKFSDYIGAPELAFEILQAVIDDCPLFYWISSSCLYTSTTLTVCVDEGYALGSTREEINEMIYNGLASVRMPEGSIYEKALYLHNMIIDNISYAYESDGVTPRNDAWAHNIDGYFTRQSGVCETYTEIFAMYLNYWGVENAQVSGKADGVGHAWNIVKMDNDEWYWFDVTWDDQKSWPMGRIYDYFCVTDSAMAGRSLDSGIYELPTRATEAFETDEIPMLNEEFTIGNFTYIVIGSNQAQLRNVSGVSGEITIPSNVEYEGRQYDVVCIADIRNKVSYGVLPYGITTLNIDSTIVYIQGNAIYVNTLKTVNYGGTREEWEKLATDLQLPTDCDVVCSDDE